MGDLAGSRHNPFLELNNTMFLGHDWSKFVEYVVKDLEGDTSEGAIERREKEMRRKIKELIPCDASNLDSFFSGEYETRQYDIVQSCTCLESILDSREAYQKGIVKLASYVKPGGYLQVLTATGGDWYSCSGLGYDVYMLNVEAGDNLKGFEMAGENINYRATVYLLLHIPSLSTAGLSIVKSLNIQRADSPHSGTKTYQFTIAQKKK